ncbi:DUF1714 domain-containing protein [Pluteus cervinus]|uniref:DUF1714 domain-containing protein n=1 Tax=Pluteus cervinus TaxID=181527 RepID=A0ACD3B6P2_9AGAR|nr:DUF1714 domain-containing protein [Pluteus cervinus]
MSINLRDTLLASLTSLPGTREFHIHVLVSSPRKHTALFPFARPRPRTYLQDILVLLSEQPTPDAPRILVTAIEACLYNIPSTSSAIFYVSKVDTTGQGAYPSPTSILVRTLLTLYANPATRPISATHFWIQLFARAQGQYLFANSSEHPGKRPLTDVKLCAWWKRVLTEVAMNLQSLGDVFSTIKPYYILPGYNEDEAFMSLRVASTPDSATSNGIIWQYGHPYSQTEIPLPCPEDTSSDQKNLGHFIPSFDDDPKSRFIDELAYTTEGDLIKSPIKKRSRTLHTEGSESKKGKDKDKSANEVDGKEEPPLGELRKVTPEEFWERMSFRQECVAGAVTGFFSLGMSSKAVKDEGGEEPRASTSAPSPLAPQPGQVSSQINKRIMTSLLTAVEFSTTERAIKATESLEGAIKGLCEGITPLAAGQGNSTGHILRAPTPVQGSSDRRTPEREVSGESTYLAPPKTPPPRVKHGKGVVVDVSPNPFPEPVTSMETYESFIYGSVGVSNPGPTSRRAEEGLSRGGQENAEVGTGQPHVTVLAVRKKKKRSA